MIRTTITIIYFWTEAASRAQLLNAITTDLTSRQMKTALIVIIIVIIIIIIIIISIIIIIILIIMSQLIWPRARWRRRSAPNLSLSL